MVRIGADPSDLEAGFKKADGFIKSHEAQFKKAGRAMTVAGAAIVGSLGLMVKGYVDAGDEIDKMSKRTGMSCTVLSELKYAADICGASLDDIEKGAKKMAKTIMDADDGMAEYIRTFDHLGLSIDDLMAMNPEQQFLAICDSIAAIESPTKRAALAQDVFGRAGTKLLPLMAEGAEGLAKLTEEAHRLGIIFDEEAAAKAAKLKDAQTDLKAAFSGVTIAIADNLVPTITSLVDKISDALVKVTEWVKENPKLAGTLVKIAAGVGVVLGVLGPLLIMLPGLAVAIGALTWPIAAVIAAVAALGVAAYLVIKHWEPIKEFFSKLWGSVSGFFVDAFNSIKAELLDWAITIVGILEKIPFAKKLAGPWKETLQSMRDEMSKTVTEVTEQGMAMAEALVDVVRESGLLEKASGLLGAVVNKLGGAFKKTGEEADDVKEKLEQTAEVINTQLYPAMNKLSPMMQGIVEQWALSTGIMKEEIINLSLVFPEVLEPAALITMDDIGKAMASLGTRTVALTQEIKKSFEETFWEIAELTTTCINGMDTAFAQAFKNQMIRIDNEEKRTYEALDNKYDAHIRAANDLLTLEQQTSAARFDELQTWYETQKKAIEDSVMDEEAKAKALRKLDNKLARKRKRLIEEREVAEKTAADNLEQLEYAKNEALRIASEDLETKRAAARKTAAKQEKAVALLSAIVNTAAGVAKALPNIPLAIAVGVLGAIQIGLIKAQPIPLKEGGLVTRPTHALIGEAGPELVIPLGKLQPALAGGMGGGFKMYNYFYGDFYEAGDVDELSRQLAEKTRRALERGRL